MAFQRREFTDEELHRMFPNRYPRQGDVRHRMFPDSFEASTSEGVWYEEYDGEKWRYAKDQVAARNEYRRNQGTY